MAETINNKPSIQIRSGLPSPLPDKSPSPATKLLISHGKPNFTIPKSPKADENGNGNPLFAQPNANNNYNAYKSANSNNVANSQKFIVGTKFNGVFKPSNALSNGNGNANGNGSSEAENEAAKVVLRRPKLADSPPPATEGEDENVPEFIRRQRRIQERLAKENVLDFESRRSGYFTHVMISPDSPNRTSFVETMASPAIVPALEIPAPVAEKVEEEEPQVAQVAAVVTSALITEPEQEAITTNGHSEEPEQPVTNGHVQEQNSEVAPEEVAKAIEQVNQAVAGEEDEPEVEATPEPTPVAAPEAVAPVATPEPVTPVAAPEAVAPVAAERKAEESTPTPAPVEAKVEVVEPAAPVQNGDAATPATNGHKEDEAEPITISHTNGQSSDGPSIPTPDPSGALGVNFEPKTVVSFSQELGGGENNYPDTVKVVNEVPSESNGELKELTKLKFDIKSDDQNEVQVTPVLRAE
ncbi:magnetosome-associated protein MamJ [Drosophila rhopaloa]|uniref:Translation initiation factor IF-2 n=1 Tax=Drosophila rhopaloa TaxID=1041015 RepID=A0A6P4E7P1_DRORH|nr:magnetosome-associated protein MamJ [Drosophila rhopaloa]XP_016973988.1 magnetosome-associated protein MamJ [Drosophila rhopaloa]XP_016973989.1 magnetosome-associated protein MamJ [Drosophila rhopaloa]